ncbi:hypothetical protein VKT23_003858 [Stygiomarasmius scandens]|uniref:Zn(2)-C6 fungal-type domain-containing protein n=1 Tax=Marasmiellus scandens TaxID=2682957 RepID=A0ABR1K2T0_9AGAR
MLAHSSSRSKSDLTDTSVYPVPYHHSILPPSRYSEFDPYSYEDPNTQGVRLPCSNSRQYPSPISEGPSTGFSPVSPSGYDQVQYPQPHSYSATDYELGGNYDLSGPIPSVSQLKRPKYPSVTGSPLSVPFQTNYHVPSSAATSSSNEDWTAIVKESPLAHSAEPSKRKPRREKPRIPLASDQPYTTQGKPRARVYVACQQCRTRKIRCDGAKPACHNCGRRNNGNSECNYDAIPRRRGPDKIPGARQRMARDLRSELDSSSRRRRRRASPSGELPKVSGYANVPDVNHGHTRSSPESIQAANAGSLSPTSSNDYLQTPYISIQEPHVLSGSGCVCHGYSLCPDSASHLYSTPKPLLINPSHYEDDVVPVGGFVTPGYITTLDDNEQESDEVHDISYEPSLNFTRKVWFDSLLALYAGAKDPHRMSNRDREETSQKITADLRFLFRVSNYWFSFFHIPSFFTNYCDPEKRERMQPSLILAALAVSTFFKSSSVELGHEGRQRALRFREHAQGAMDASFNAGFIDETLAQAAWLLALFEVCVHPNHTTRRSVSAITMLDSIIRSLSLTSVDFNDPQASVFTPGEVPAIGTTSAKQWSQPSTAIPGHSFPYPTSASTSIGTSGCSCATLTLGKHWPSSLEYAPMWTSTPAWDPSWTEAEVRKESCRRLCWSAISLAAGHVSYAMASHSHGLDLFIADPANFTLLFSGESIIRSPSLASSKDTVWALYDRSFLLWHICVKMRNSTQASDDEKAQFAYKAWLEADAIEEALNKHTCDIEKAFIFQGREYLFNTRMCITYEYQRYIPLVPNNVPGFFHREKAEHWLKHQREIARRFMHGLHTITGNSKNHLLHRPFFVFWFMSQIFRALSLWECDNTMTIALDVCKAFTPAVDYLSALWPCHEQRDRYERLHARLTRACYAANIAPPRPPNFSLTLSLTPENC